jgi:hypothetical protein
LGDEKTGRRKGEPKRQYKLLHGISFDLWSKNRIVKNDSRSTLSEFPRTPLLTENRQRCVSEQKQ